METTNQLFNEYVELARRGPILYRADPALPRLFSAEIKNLQGAGVPQGLLRATFDTFTARFAARDPDVEAEYRRAYGQLVTDVKGSEEYKQYLASPSKQSHDRLLARFRDAAPVHTILKAAELAEWSQQLFANKFPVISQAHSQELHMKVRELIAIQADEPNLETAVRLVVAALESCDSMLVAYMLLIGFTPEGFALKLKDMPEYVYDRTLTGLVFSGLKNFTPFSPADEAYAAWRYRLFAYASIKTPQYLSLFESVCPAPIDGLITNVIPPELRDVVELAGGAYAALCTVFETEAVQQMILPRLAHMYIDALAPEETPVDMPFRNWAWRVLPDVSKAATGVFEAVARWVFTTRRMASAMSVPATILSPVIGFVYTTATALYELADRLIEVLVYGLDKFASPFSKWLKEYLYLGRAWSSVVLPGARRRPKSVWALLFVNDFTRLDPGTRFALSCNVMQQGTSPSFEEWQLNLQKAINDTKLADYELFPHPPLRPLRLPRNPITVDEEILALAPLFPGQSRVTDIMDDKFKKWVQYNVPQGIDGQWFATPDRVAQSINRYNIERVRPGEYEKGLMRECAHALADKYPEMYKNHRYFTVGHAMRRLKWDTSMSPGLGFMGNVRRRSDLRKHGFLDAIQQVAERHLMEGIAPGSVAHVFVKEQVVSLEKLLKGKNIRTVTAMDLMSNTLALPFSIELSRAPPPEAYVLNALPRSEGGYRPLLEDLKKHALVLQADGHQFDSTLGPVVSVDGLAELRSIGFEQNPAFPIIKSQISSHYFHMAVADLVDLTTGIVFKKTGGTMTGQVNTSYDNRDSLRLVLIFGWAHVSGRPPIEFFDRNTLGNAGDDHLFGTEETYDFWLQAFEWITASTGVKFEIEQDRWDDISITALQPTPEMLDTAFYRAQMGMPAVDFGIRTEPAKLLLTKTEFKARHARLSDIPFRQAHVDSMVGTAYLSAYNPEIYNDLADLYKADLTFILLRFYEKLNIEEVRDQFGNLAQLKLTGERIRPRYKAQEHRIDNMINAWLKKVQWPSYQKVFNIWVRPYDEGRSSIAKHYRTLVSGGPALPVAIKLLYGLVGFRESLYTIPNHVVRALPEFPGADVSMTLKTPEYIVERFVWLSLFTRTRAIPTKQAFMNALREGPYASACSPVDFLEALELPGMMDELVKTDLELLRGQAIAVTLVYSMLEVILNAAAQTPFLGLAVTLYALATRDVNRLYATANHIYWLSEGRSSSVISNLMPADPYAWMKQLSVICVTGVPPTWLNIPGTRHLVKWAPAMVEAWTMAAATVTPNVPRMIHDRSPPLNTPWAAVIDRILAQVIVNERFSATVVAPTGSGKSTLFVALLRQVFPRKRIWLLHPTIAARDEYANDFLPEGEVQVLLRNVYRRVDAMVLSVTYGYFAQIINTVLEDDIVILDEVHLSTTEMWVAWWLAHGQTRFCMTATPKYALQPRTDVNIEYPGRRRFTMKMTYVNQTFEQLWTFLSSSRRHLLARALIICPTIKKVSWVRNTLARLSYASSELSSDYPIPAQYGIIVATSIADQALTITPPPSTVIDLGEMLDVKVVNRLGQLRPEFVVKIIPVSQEVADQRAGRGGRAGDCEGYGLLNAPRSEHQPPQRFPTAVFLHDDVVDSVMVSLGLRNALTPLNDLPGLLKYVGVYPQADRIPNAHNLKGALVALLYLSSGAAFETFTNDLLNWRHADNLSDQMRVYDMQASRMFPEPQTILCEHAVVENLLDTGTFFAQVAHRRVPMACFVFDDGWLTPAGQDPAVMFTGAPQRLLPSTMAPIVYRGVNKQNWEVMLTHFVVTDELQLWTPQGLEDAQLWLPGDDPVVTGVTVRALSLLIHERTRQALASARRPGRCLRVVVTPQQETGLCCNVRVLVEGHVQPLRNTMWVDLVDVRFEVKLWLPLLVTMACALDDDQLLLFGAAPGLVALDNPPRAHRNMIWGPPDNVASIFLSPLACRMAFSQASSLLEAETCSSLFTTIPFVIMDDLEHYAAWAAIVPNVVFGSLVNSRLVFN